MAIIRALTEQLNLDQLVAEQPLNPFLQSWTWGDFQKSIGRKIWRLGAWAGDQLVGAALVVEHQLILGKTYLYCPRGPLAASLPVLQELLSAIRDLGQKEDSMYVKVDPGLYHFPFGSEQFSPEYTIGTTLQPQNTLVIDVSHQPAEMLELMHQKTRYNIRLAEKKGVTVRWSNSDDDLAIFLQMMHATAERQGIRLHDDSYYQHMFMALRKNSMAELVFGSYYNQVQVANLVIWHDQTATYLHGGSRDDHKDVMAPQLVQWETMKRAHDRGVKDYDLWGVAPEEDTEHAWAGISRFKRGFGGREVDFPPAANTILQPQWYTAYRLAKRMRGGRDE